MRRRDKDRTQYHTTQRSLLFILGFTCAFTAVHDSFYWLHTCPSLVGYVPHWREAPPVTLHFFVPERRKGVAV